MYSKTSRIPTVVVSSKSEEGILLRKLLIDVPSPIVSFHRDTVNHYLIIGNKGVNKHALRRILAKRRTFGKVPD